MTEVCCLKLPSSSSTLDLVRKKKERKRRRRRRSTRSKIDGSNPRSRRSVGRSIVQKELILYFDDEQLISLYQDI